MSQNPAYAQDGDADAALGPSRTSVLAIFSLICGVVCIIPGLGLLASMLGIASLIGITRSRGRVGGTGFAVTGIILGMIGTLLWTTVVVGGQQVAKKFSQRIAVPASEAIVALDGGDAEPIKKLLVPAAAAKITDADIAAFRAGYQASAGSFKALPTKMVDLIKSYMKVGPMIKPLAGSSNMIPFPAEFEKGAGIVVLITSPTGASQVQQQGPNAPLVPYVNIQFRMSDGKVFDLVPGGPGPNVLQPGGAIVPLTPKSPDAPAPTPPEAPKGPGGS